MPDTYTESKLQIFYRAKFLATTAIQKAMESENSTCFRPICALSSPLFLSTRSWSRSVAAAVPPTWHASLPHSDSSTAFCVWACEMSYTKEKC